MKSADLKVDGNAVAGLLSEVFAFEVTGATGTCANCGNVAAVGAVYAYVEAPGVVLRCPVCSFVLMRVVRSDDRLWLEMRGVRSLEFRPGAG
jgi:creatinine amidohydrolase/Fe(II)-dependent formamide hydrolase-like protein